MSKYESAYKFIELCVKPWVHKEDLDKPLNTQKQDNLNILKEAVEKANKFDEKEIPKKPYIAKYDDGGYKVKCPTCKDVQLEPVTVPEKAYQHRYCPKCGQAIDWSKEDE